MLTQMQCGGCKQALGVTPNFNETVEDVKALGEMIHGSTKLICPKPQISLIFVNILIDETALAEAQQQVQSCLNGKGH